VKRPDKEGIEEVEVSEVGKRENRTKRLGSRRTEVRGLMKRRSTRPGSEKVE